MTQPDARLLIIVPTRSRPENVKTVVKAWEDTDAFRHADLCFAHDYDDPRSSEYGEALRGALETLASKGPLRRYSLPTWLPLVPKLNTVASSYATWFSARYFAIGFAGDDHLPRTHGWAARYLEALIEMGTGVTSCPDGYRDDELPTQWAMTADIVRTLGRMVPAPVEHLYCDDAVRDLAKAVGCWRYLDDVLIEHMHPLAKKAKFDAQYRHVNREEQYVHDSHAYETWRAGDTPSGGLGWDAEKVRDLIKASR